MEMRSSKWMTETLKDWMKRSKSTISESSLWDLTCKVIMVCSILTLSLRSRRSGISAGWLRWLSRNFLNRTQDGRNTKGLFHLTFIKIDDIYN